MSSRPILYQTMITRLPYAESYPTHAILEATAKVEDRALISIAIPIHVDNPFGAIEFVSEMVKAGLHLVSIIAWNRDRHVVVTKSRRLTNQYELIAIFSRSKNYIISKDQIRKMKRGFEGKENTFDPDEFLCCAGDMWSCRNDRRDRRFLPATIVLNCGQLADLKQGDSVLDPYGIPSIRETCQSIGWKYVDGGLPSVIRGVKKTFLEKDE